MALALRRHSSASSDAIDLGKDRDHPALYLFDALGRDRLTRASGSAGRTRAVAENPAPGERFGPSLMWRAPVIGDTAPRALRRALLKSPSLIHFDGGSCGRRARFRPPPPPRPLCAGGDDRPSIFCLLPAAARHARPRAAARGAYHRLGWPFMTSWPSLNERVNARSTGRST